MAKPTESDLTAAARLCYGLLNGEVALPCPDDVSPETAAQCYLTLFARVYNHKFCKDITDEELEIFRELARKYLPTLH